MGEDRISRQAHITIDDHTFALSPDQDLDELKEQIEAAADKGGRFVRFGTADGAEVSSFLSARRLVTIAVGEPTHASDAGETPYPGDPDLFDFTDLNG